MNYAKRSLFVSVALAGFLLSAGAQGQSSAPDPASYYKLQTQFRGDGECFEGNETAGQAKNGTAFMDKCQNVSGQLWQFVPEGSTGYYRLKTQFRGDGECLEGNEAQSTVHGGAAFMDKCQNVSGQLWKLVKQ